MIIFYYSNARDFNITGIFYMQLSDLVPFNDGQLYRRNKNK